MENLVHRDNIGEILQRIYDSEINLSTATFWDGGWWYSTETNPYPEDEIKGMEATDKKKIEEVLSTIVDDILIQYPTSTFAKWANSVDLSKPIHL